MHLDGRHLGTPDFLDVSSGVAGQYDGKVHLVGSRRARDLGKDDGYRRAGLELFTLVSEDLADVERVVAPMRDTRQRAVARRAVDGPWTLVRPRGGSPPTRSRCVGVSPRPSGGGTSATGVRREWRGPHGAAGVPTDDAQVSPPPRHALRPWVRGPADHRHVAGGIATDDPQASRTYWPTTVCSTA